MENLYAKIVRLDAGYEAQQKQIKENFFIGQVLLVTDINMGGFMTDIRLKGYKDCFNSVFFEFYDDIECKEKHDIYRDEKYNPYMRRR